LAREECLVLGRQARKRNWGAITVEIADGLEWSLESFFVFSGGLGRSCAATFDAAERVGTVLVPLSRETDYGPTRLRFFVDEGGNTSTQATRYSTSSAGNFGGKEKWSLAFDEGAGFTRPSLSQLRHWINACGPTRGTQGSDEEIDPKRLSFESLCAPNRPSPGRRDRGL